MSYRRLLVPLDDSPTAKRGLDEAIALARDLNSTVVLLHVMEMMPMVPEVGTSEAWDAIRDGLRTTGQRLLDAAAERVRAAGITCETVLGDVEARRPADVIVEAATAQRCDVIVMGTHGRRGISRALLGSDAELVLRESPVPVLLVRGAAARAG
ncbi:MAG: universal stress protein [Rubrivivax sp.]|jgi:nucleotide-binding universal stress UspA family protein|nr:universal stress protein [Rubrivivax sp.]